MKKDMELTLRLNADGTAMITTVKKADNALGGLGKSAQAANDSVTKTRKGLDSISTQLARTKAQILGFIGFQAIGARLNGLVRDLSGVAQATGRWQSRLTVATGSADAAARELEFVRAKAKELHLSLRSTAEGYSSFATAAKLAGMETENVRRTFSGVSQAAMAMKLSADQQQRALIALSQMASKGVVSMEELRQQLGEAIPGAFSLAAQSMGMTEQAFSKAVAKGEILANDLLPKLGDAMQKTFADTEPDEFVAAINDMKTAWFEFFEGLDDAGTKNAMTEVLKAMTAALRAVTPLFGGLVSAIKPLMALLAGWAAYSYLPGLINKIAMATRAWATAETLLNAQLGAGLILGHIKNVKVFKGTISGTVSALSSLKGAVGAAAAAFASWEIGKWAYNNFGVVRAVSYSVVVSLIDKWDGFVTWMAQVFNHVTSFGVMAVNAIKGGFDWLVTQGKNAGLKIENFFKEMYLKLLQITKGAVEKVGSAWKSVSASVNGMMAKGLEKVRNGLQGLDKAGLVPNKLINAVSSAVAKLQDGAKDTAYHYTGLDEKIKGIGKTIAANNAQIAANNAAHEKYTANLVASTEAAVQSTLSKNSVLQQMRDEMHTYNMQDIDDYMSMVAAGQDVAKVQKTVAKEVKETNGEIEKTGTAAGKGGKGLNTLGSAAKQAADELAQMKKAANEAAAGLFGSLFPGKKLLIDMKKDAATLAKAVNGDASDAMYEFGVSVADVKEKQAELNKIISDFKAGALSKEQAKKAFDAMKGGIEGVKEEAKQTSSVLETQFKRAVESIDQSFANMWKSVLSGGKVSFKSLGDDLKNIFAETLHGLTTQRLTGWVSGIFTDAADQDGNAKTSKSAKNIMNTLTDGFDKMEKSFTSNIQDLLGVQEGTAKILGSALAGGVIGAGIGTGVSAMMGADTAIGSLGGAIGGALGNLAASSAFISGITGTLGTVISAGLPIVGSLVGSLLGSLLGRKEDPTSRAWVRADGTVSHTRDNKIDGDVTKSAGFAFWDSAKATAAIYGVQFADSLTTAMTYKVEEKGGLKYYFDLFSDVDLDGKRDGDLFYHAALAGDDANDPEKVALAMAQMTVAALAQADWSGISSTIEDAMNLVNAESMSTDDITAFNEWIDRTLLMARAFGGEVGDIGDNLEVFGGSLTKFQEYTTAAYDLITRYGENTVNDLKAYLSENAGADWADTAQSFNVITASIDMLGQTSFATNQELIAASAGITGAMGGYSEAMGLFATIFEATATKTHKAGVNYRNQKQAVDVLNAAMELSGTTYIGTTDRLREYVANLDPLSDGYAEQIRWASKMAASLSGLADASAYFADAIEGINSTISGVVSDIREDLMSDEALYNSRKTQAESLAASIAGMTDVSEIEAAVSEASALVSNMWRSLSDEQQTSGVGNWMIDYLNELDTLAAGTIETIQNQYGADNATRDGYDTVRTAAMDSVSGEITIDTAALAVEMEAAADIQVAAGDKQLAAGETMASAAQTLTSAAASLAKSAGEYGKGYDVNVTVHSVSEATEMT